jgi:hypothetical protein
VVRHPLANKKKKKKKKKRKKGRSVLPLGVVRPPQWQNGKNKI